MGAFHVFKIVQMVPKGAKHLQLFLTINKSNKQTIWIQRLQS